MKKGEKKNNPTKDEQDRFKNTYKRKIIELVEEIDRQETLVRIYSFITGLQD